ncbi:MAG: CCA tRNA nucleotidyltransferase [Bdellovibrionales bacterium]|nr:CCA tRNA nucleotidyltransferase [Bdellovibrionales bacterium]
MNTELLSLFQTLAQCAEELKLTVFVVGGFVRDCLLGLRISDADVDVVLEGDTTAYAERLHNALGGEIATHPKFLTKKLHSLEGVAVCEIDIIQARTESYVVPGALPMVRAGTLREDLERRDFSINCLACALELSPALLDGTLRRDQIVGTNQAFSDLKGPLLRVLHEKSFQDDPTRLFRLLRYQSRLGASIETATQRLFESAIEQRVLESISAFRIASELWKILHEKNVVAMWTMLQRYGLLQRRPFRGLATPEFLQGLSVLARKENVSDLEWLCLMSLFIVEADLPDFWQTTNTPKAGKKLVKSSRAAILGDESADLTEELRSVSEIFKQIQ